MNIEKLRECRAEIAAEVERGQPSSIAREAAEQFYNPSHAPYETLESAKLSLKNVIQSAIDRAIDQFVDDLFTDLNERGITTDDWDGDEPAHQIIASGIAGAIENAKDRALAAAQAEQLAELQYYNQKQADKIAELEKELERWKRICRNRDATVNQQGEEWVKLKTEIDALRTQLDQANAVYTAGK